MQRYTSFHYLEKKIGLFLSLVPFLLLSGCTQLFLGDKTALCHPDPQKALVVMDSPAQSDNRIDQNFSRFHKEARKNKMMPENFQKSRVEDALFTMPRVKRNQLSDLEVVLMDSSIGNYKKSQKDLIKDADGTVKTLKIARKNSLFSGNAKSTQEVVVPAAHPWSSLGLQPLE